MYISVGSFAEDNAQDYRAYYRAKSVLTELHVNHKQCCYEQHFLFAELINFLNVTVYKTFIYLRNFAFYGARLIVLLRIVNLSNWNEYNPILTNLTGLYSDVVGGEWF